MYKCMCEWACVDMRLCDLHSEAAIAKPMHLCDMRNQKCVSFVCVRV